MLVRDASTAEVVAELQKRVQETPSLEPLIPVYEALLTMEEKVETLPLPVEYDPSEARTVLGEGTPLLQRVGNPVVLEPMAGTWQQVCDLADQHLVNQTERLQEVREWPEAQQEEWLALMGQYFRDGEVTAEPQEEKDLLTFLMVHTWRPFLRRWAVDVAPLVEEEVWKQERCPVCGGQVDFAYLGEEGGERYLICSRCDTEWRYKRLGCPFCGNWDASTFGYYAQQEGAYRLYVCQDCKRYLKVLDMRQGEEKHLLMVERIATIGMDLSALRAGHRSS